MNRTFRWLDEPPKLLGLTIWQWAALFFGGGGLGLLLHATHVPTKPAITVLMIVVGAPVAFTYLGDETGISVGRTLLDALMWRRSAHRHRPGADVRAAGVVVHDAPEPGRGTARARRTGRGPAMHSFRRGARAPGDLVDLEALSPSGVGINSEGALVRWLEITAPVNALIMDEDGMREVSRAFAKVCAGVPHGQQLQLYVHATPLPIDDIVAGDLAATGAAVQAARNAGDDDHADALARLQFTSEHSLRTHSAAVAAKRMRYVIVCPWQPQPATLLRPRSRPGTAVVLTRQQLATASDGAARYTEAIIADLEALDLSVRSLDGHEVLDLLWERFSPSAAAGRQPPPSVTRPGVLRPLDAASTAEQAAEHAAQLRAAIAQEPIDCTGREQLTLGDSLEQSLYLSGIPDFTWLGWLLHLMQLASPFALSIHVHPTERYRERHRQKRRHKRLRGVNRGKQRSGRDLDADEEAKEEEAAELNRELTHHAGAGIYRLAILLSVRETDGDQRLLSEQVKSVIREIATVLDGHLSGGVFNQPRLLRSTMPTGVDVARRLRRFASRNLGDTMPLLGTGCGSPAGVPIGYAHPGLTLERLDPFDPEHPNHVLVVNGRSGTGKTMTTIVLLARALARGATGFIIDRAGHFQFLCGLLPGALSLRIGAGEHEHAINPWDTPDVARVPRKKIAYLKALHALLIGTHDAGDSFDLDPLERSQLDVAIRGVYERCALTGERPRETILQEELYRRARDEQDAGAHDIAVVLRSLAERLHDYVAGGAYAYLTDARTTIPERAPLVAFDTKDIPDEVAPAALFIIAEAVIRHVETDRERQLADVRHADSESWIGRSFLVIDEAWKVVERRATGRMVMEWGKRSRHLALWLIAITQQMEDLDNPYGRALLNNASMRLFLRQNAKDLQLVQSDLGLTGEAIEAIKSLRTAKRQFSMAYLMNGSRGQGIISVRVSDYEYWIASNEPVRDEPLRRAALRDAARQASSTDWRAHWQALHKLADPDWHAARLHTPAGNRLQERS